MRAGLQQRRHRELLTWRTVKMIYVGGVHNFWAAEVTGKSYRIGRAPPAPPTVGCSRAAAGDRWVGRGGGPCNALKPCGGF